MKRWNVCVVESIILGFILSLKRKEVTCLGLMSHVVHERSCVNNSHTFNVVGHLMCVFECGKTIYKEDERFLKLTTTSNEFATTLFFSYIYIYIYIYIYKEIIF